MKIGSAFPGEFWRTADGGWPRKLTISHFEEKVKVGEDIKPAIFFVGEERGLVLGKITGEQVAEVCGSDETDDWTAREIVVYVDPNVTFGNKKTGGLRVRAPKQQAAAPKPVAPRPAPTPRSDPARDDMDDEIPW